MLFGVGISMIIDAELGAAPWDVFHTGVSEITGVSVGNVVILTGLALLLVWIPLRERPGLGTLLNATVIGVVVDITLPWIPHTSLLVMRTLLMLGGVTVIAVGSGFYIGAGLGPGPRDGLMTGLAKRSIVGRQISIRAWHCTRRIGRHRNSRICLHHRPSGAGVSSPPHNATRLERAMPTSSSREESYRRDSRRAEISPPPSAAQ